MNIPKLSIIIPVYNAQAVLNSTLDSAAGQTLRDLEIICINDGSTDRSPEILREYAKKDLRFKLLDFPDNRGSYLARKAGVAASTGEYLLFLNAGDTLPPESGMKLYGDIREKGVDILQFPVKIIDTKGSAEFRITSLQTLLRVHCGRLTNAQIVRSCFEKREHTPHLWNKLFSGKRCKEAFKDAEDGRFPKGQKYYAYFLIASRSASFDGCTDENPCCIHNFGNGQCTLGVMVDLRFIEREASQAEALNALGRHLERAGLSEQYGAMFEKFRHTQLSAGTWFWMERLPREDQAAGFDALVKHWGGYEVVTTLMSQYSHEREQISRRCLGASTLIPPPRKIRTIGIFYHRINCGGIQRVISQLIPMWLSLGYRVVLLTDEPPEENDFPLPPDVRRIVLPSTFKVRPANYHLRARALLDVLATEQIDVLNYHAWMSSMLFWDMLLCKTSGVPVVVNTHSVFSAPSIARTSQMSDIAHILRHCDRLAVLSHVDAMYYNGLGIPTWQISNPFPDWKAEHRPLPSHPTVLWVGRISWEKRPLELARIFVKAAGAVPEAKLQIVGDGDRNLVNSMKRIFAEAGLENRVEFCGFQKDVAPYYKTASVLLMTSRFEGFSCVFLESQLYGVPCVMYELPYLELPRSGKGFVAVPQGAVNSAAAALAELLQSPDQQKKLGEEARRNAENFTAVDLRSKWSDLFSSLETGEWFPGETLSSRDDLKTMLRTLTDHENQGRDFIIDEYERKLRELRNSEVYRLGCRLLYLKKKLKGGIQCYRENGIPYTLRHLGQKIAKRLKKR